MSERADTPHTLEIVRLPGLTDYARAWALQRAIHDEVASDSRADTLLLLEHPPTLTMGRRGGWTNLVTAPETLVQLGFELYGIDRGGDITYHGPGQLVGYPIVNLRRAALELGDFIRAMEAAHLDALAERGIDAQRDPGFTGVWCGNDKITAIGVRVTRWTTLHGFAINVGTRLADFEHIVACGLEGRGVTSLERLGGGAPVDMAEVEHALARALASRFGLEPVQITPDALPAVDEDAVEAIRRETRVWPPSSDAV